MADGSSFPCDPTRGPPDRLESPVRTHVSTLLQDRYGRRPPPSRRLVIAATAAVLVLVLAYVGWLAAARTPRLGWTDIGFNVVSDAAVQVTFDLDFRGSPAGDPVAACTVQALNPLKTEVGLREVRLRPGPEGRVRATVEVRTSERATAALVKTCTLL